jgi:hypothetical protein
MLHRVVWQILTDVSEEFTASIIRAMSRRYPRRRENLKSPLTTTVF